MTQDQITCKWCGVPLSSDHTGPCPNCGEIGRHIKMEPLTGVLRPIGTVTGIVTRTIHRRGEIVKNKTIKRASHAISLVLTCLALLLTLLAVPVFYCVVATIASFFITELFAPFLLEKLFKPKP